MLTYYLIALSVLLCAVTLQAAELPVMPVGAIVEDRYNGDDLALVVPDRLEMICEGTS